MKLRYLQLNFKAVMAYLGFLHLLSSGCIKTDVIQIKSEGWLICALIQKVRFKEKFKIRKRGKGQKDNQEKYKSQVLYTMS